MERPSRIPLFPLDVVLLPGMTLPLHIFEPRYKLMIRRCLEEKIEFGMVLSARKNVAAVGGTAKIMRKVKDYPDGRMDIVTEGREVFALREVFDELEYYEGQVEYLRDEVAAIDSQQEKHMTEMFQQCHSLLFGQGWLRRLSPQACSPIGWRPSCRWNCRSGKRSSKCVTSPSAARLC